jgi:hypothetical protein
MSWSMAIYILTHSRHEYIVAYNLSLSPSLFTQCPSISHPITVHYRRKLATQMRFVSDIQPCPRHTMYHLMIGSFIHENINLTMPISNYVPRVKKENLLLDQSHNWVIKAKVIRFCALQFVMQKQFPCDLYCINVKLFMQNFLPCPHTCSYETNWPNYYNFCNMFNYIKILV